MEQREELHTALRTLGRALPLATLVLLASCSKGASYSSAAGAKFASMESADEASFSGGFNMMADYDEAVAESEYEAEAPLPSPAEAKAAGTGAAAKPQAYERKLIRTGHISLEVASLSEVKGSIESWVKKYGGYVASSNESGNSVSFTVKIPSPRFEEAMGETASFGKIRNKNISSQDVTERYYDLKTRLEAKRVMQERLEGYLKSAKDIKDMMEIEGKLNDVTADLEAMQGQLNRLSSQIDFSEINIDARLRPNQTETGFTMPDVGGKFSDLLSNVVYFFVGLLFVLIYAVIFGVPIILVLALLYWLCFGKIGLLRKLFARLKK